jgi:hypothetical protein
MGVYTDEGASKRNRVITYVVLGVIFLILAIVAMGTFRAAQESREARDMATQLQQEFKAAGLPEPNVDQAVLQFGTDGGIVCAAAANEPTARAQLADRLATAAGNPGARAVGAPGLGAGNQVVTALQQVIKVYCPQYMNDFVSYINGLRLSKTSQSS